MTSRSRSEVEFSETLVIIYRDLISRRHPRCVYVANLDQLLLFVVLCNRTGMVIHMDTPELLHVIIIITKNQITCKS